MLNHQAVEKQKLHAHGTLDVHSVFYTIQGEGPFAGRPAVFIRLAGCNLMCPMCDTNYTEGRTEYTVERLIFETCLLVPGHSRPLVVITGGEPFRQTLYGLIFGLASEGFQVQIETNGTLYQDLPWDYVTVICSPKTGSLNKKLLPHIAALKYVLHADEVAADDGLPLSALGHPNSGRVARPPVGFSGTIYLQPIDTHSGAWLEDFETPHLTACVESCMRYGYTLGIQLHKYINLA